ncbi:hypothetical protein ANN_27737 [Periplaneta americana]|uniref:Uncharacterized protein n=1 Tax=Periplaneta americana TaxID=6978 RepID=A0ABQ8RV33_PERAM|nr:hypothetical protein ANN_27737 [Periplaneta americana]
MSKGDVDDHPTKMQEENLLDLHVAGIKTECVDHRYDLTSDTKVIEAAVPTNLAVTKYETERGDLKITDNYRGISLLNAGYKIYANILKNKLNKHYDNIISEEQNGFRRGRSCCDGYFALKLLVEKHREFNLETHMAFIDFKKAFDKVNRNKLLQILADDQIPQQIIQNIYNIYKTTIIAIRSNNKLSQWRPIYSGVRQGCGLSPLLFIIYINRIIQDWRQTRHGFIPINRNLQLDALLFADDLVLMASTEDDLQYSVHNLNKEELCDLDTVKDELKLEVTTEENKILTDSLADSNDRTVSSECEGFAHETHMTNCEAGKHSVFSTNNFRALIDDKSFKCDVSEKCSSTSGNLKCHIRKNTDAKSHERQHIDDRPYKCNVCGKCFSQRCNLKRHETVHTGEKRFQCVDCGKFFSQRSGLKLHRVRHSGEKPFKCDTCLKCFTRPSDLKRHKRLHSDAKPFKCVVCEKTFQQRSYLKRHVHTVEKPFKCDDCGKYFAQSHSLKMHARYHTGEKPLLCDICGETFSHWNPLIRHKRQHTCEKPFQCDVCGKCFTESSGLKRHERRHTGEKPFKCDVCGMLFTYQSNLRRHEGRHSSKPFE